MVAHRSPNLKSFTEISSRDEKSAPVDLISSLWNSSAHSKFLGTKVRANGAINKNYKRVILKRPRILKSNQNVIETTK